MAWPDDAKKTWLNNGLLTDILKARLAVYEPDSYVEYIQELYVTSSNIVNLRKNGGFASAQSTRKEERNNRIE